MANLGGTFDASQVEPSKPQEALPPGEYRVQIINSEMRVTKAGTGQYLWLEMDVLDGVHAGRKVYEQLNLVNPNQQAVEISQRALSAICHALGRMQVQDSEELHFKPMLIKVAVDKSGYNKIKGYKAVSRPMAAPPPPPPPPQQTYQQPTAPQQQSPAPQQQSPAPQQGYQPPAPTASGAGPWNSIRQ
ncbi:DUF669 domain-containing protein [Magnetofaba australis]|uniref:DUF669 domain-containing protein n=1 Tax=Magnetofaba australis IT-1 TaxID=1434232 RepID=A0A1Y2KC81_9PROT|nr:DUF669 domain-containing protein [Magnetofaba australis]OSM07626.1 hypothetical protein MAIT1_04395 [Magnetofaba australis IT-1]